MARKSKGGNIGSLWRKARERTQSDTGADFVPVDAGRYVMQIVGVSADTFNKVRKLMVRWCVLKDDDFKGRICTDFMSIDTEEKMDWVLRLLVALGVDTQECEEPDTEDALLGIFRDCIKERKCIKVKVVEDGEYTNLKLGGACDVEDEDTVDPEEAIKGRAFGGGESSSEAGSDEDVEFEVGDRVEWVADSKEYAGVIEDFTKDDDAIVKVDGKRKTVTMPLDDLDKEDDGSAAEDAEKDVELEVGDRVSVIYDGVPWEGAIITLGANSVTVKFEEDGSEEDVAYEELTKLEVEVDIPFDGKKEADATAPLAVGDRVSVAYDGVPWEGAITARGGGNATIKFDEDDSEDEVAYDLVTKLDAEAQEVEVGDDVLVKVRGRQRSGKVAAVSSDGSTCDVKVGKQTISNIPVDDVDFDTDG